MERPERTEAAPGARALPADEKTERGARARSSGAGPTAGKQQRQKPTGAMAAVRAGIATVGILTAQPAAALYDVGASLCVKDFAAGELLEAISGEDSLFL